MLLSEYREFTLNQLRGFKIPIEIIPPGILEYVKFGVKEIKILLLSYESRPEREAFLSFATC